ncbi:MAG: hypothetical protein ACETWM_09060 [Candidatus Lokiarchaeia archaeon]
MNHLIILFLRNLLSIAARWLPMWFLYSVSAFFAGLYFFLGDTARLIRNVFQNFNGLSQDAVRRLIRDLLVNWYNASLKRVICGSLPRKKVEEMIIPVGFQYIDEALRLGRGVVLFSMHSAPIPMMYYIALRGYKVNLLVTRRAYALLKELYHDRINLITSFREMEQCLKRNEILFMLIDGREGKRPIKARLNGKEILFVPGIVILAKKANAPLVPFVNLRQKRGKLKCIVKRMIKLDLSNLDNQDRIREEIQKCVNIVEPYFQENPNQFYIFIRSRNKSSFYV